MIVEIAFPIPVDRVFTYSVPETIQSKIKEGIKVRAPFGRRDMTGWVVNTAARTGIKNLKDIRGVVEDELMITPPLLALARWMSGYYICSLGQALDAVLSHNFRPVKSRIIKSIVQPAGNMTAWIPLPEQKEIIGRIRKDIFKKVFSPFLLKGGSDTGKTEVYMQCIAAVQETGRSSVFMVPEISLTPQFIRMFEERFGRDRVGVWHSRLSQGQRYEVRESCRKGKLDVLIGTMSAVFVPCRDLGLIIVDEEHDSSYKHDRTPLYNTRDVAVKRAELEGTVVLLGSSTPGFESFYRAENGEYELLNLSQRIGREELPSVKVVDMKEGLVGPGKYFRLSSKLYRAIEDRINRKEQVILFLNRRGYFRHVMCRGCGEVVKCPECNVPLVYHVRKTVLRCHYCGYKRAMPRACPECRSGNIRFSGSGIQRIEEELGKKIPGARIARLDSDALKKRGNAEKIISDFSNGRINVLIGTQLVAKGWDFPGVSLVGVVSADELLYLPDFRANERFFSTIAQVAGRSGRGAVRGEIYIQTYNPSDEVFGKIADYDYLSFYRDEMKIRKELGYPPFSQLVNITISGKSEKDVEEFAGKAGKILNELVSGREYFSSPDDIIILGPGPAPFSILRGNHRWQIIIKRKPPLDSLQLQNMLKKMLSLIRSKKVKIKIDIDPVNML